MKARKERFDTRSILLNLSIFILCAASYTVTKCLSIPKVAVEAGPGLQAPSAHCKPQRMTARRWHGAPHCRQQTPQKQGSAIRQRRH